MTQPYKWPILTRWYQYRCPFCRLETIALKDRGRVYREIKKHMRFCGKNPETEGGRLQHENNH